MTGRVLENWLIRSSIGETIYSIEKPALTSGVYFVKIRNQNSVKTLKVIVQ